MATSANATRQAGDARNIIGFFVYKSGRVLHVDNNKL